MKKWEKQAILLLDRSLNPIPQELDELDWKYKLSPKSERLAHHISAFANNEGGGFFVFGISNKGEPKGMSNKDYTKIIEKMGNVVRDGLEPSVSMQHSILEYNDIALLFVFINESKNKPAHLRGKDISESYIRSACQTRKMTKNELKQCISKSGNLRFEEEIALKDQSSDDVLQKLDYAKYFELLNIALPENKTAILDMLASDKLIEKQDEDYTITNLGALLFAKEFEDFSHLKRKSVRVVIYDGIDRLKTIKEQEDRNGYASGFEGLVKYINDQLPTNEVIEQALRKQVKVYPEIAIRELVANSIIHQDYYATGTGPMVEIFSNRIEISNPGKPLINTLRFIDFPPRSRNEITASFMRRINICEERGSGIDKVINWIEVYQLPAPDFIETATHLTAILYAPKSLAKMDKSDRVRACYHHCCRKCVSRDEKMSNSSLRKRFNISEKNYPMASRIIADTIDAKLIKLADPSSKSKKYAYYVPFWA